MMNQNIRDWNHVLIAWLHCFVRSQIIITCPPFIPGKCYALKKARMVAICGSFVCMHTLQTGIANSWFKLKLLHSIEKMARRRATLWHQNLVRVDMQIHTSSATAKLISALSTISPPLKKIHSISEFVQYVCSDIVHNTNMSNTREDHPKYVQSTASYYVDMAEIWVGIHTFTINGHL